MRLCPIFLCVVLPFATDIEVLFILLFPMFYSEEILLNLVNWNAVDNNRLYCSLLCFITHVFANDRRATDGTRYFLKLVDITGSVLLILVYFHFRGAYCVSVA